MSSGGNGRKSVQVPGQTKASAGQIRRHLVFSLIQVSFFNTRFVSPAVIQIHETLNPSDAEYGSHSLNAGKRNDPQA